MGTSSMGRGLRPTSATGRASSPRRTSTAGSRRLACSPRPTASSTALTPSCCHLASCRSWILSALAPADGYGGEPLRRC
eukprot:jgi/Mesen1/9820/ME000007S09876